MNLIPAIMGSLEKLPPLPPLAYQAIEMIHQEQVSLQELVEVVRYDPALTANILRLCNSPYFGLREEVHSLQQALLLLGTQQLLKLFIAGGVSQAFNRATPVYFSEVRGLWRHSVNCALMVSLLAQELTVEEESFCFTAGLLHDVGKLALAIYVDRQFPQIIELVEKRKLPFQAAERLVLGIDHAEVGGEMARIWRFPSRLGLAIAGHHLDKIDAWHDDLTLLVYLADMLVLMFGQDLGQDGLAYTLRPEILQHFQLRQKDLDRMLLKFDGLWRRAQGFLHFAEKSHVLQCSHR